jgi:hypothetical protein
VDAASHRVLEEFVREVTAPERDELVVNPESASFATSRLRRSRAS